MYETDGISLLLHGQRASSLLIFSSVQHVPRSRVCSLLTIPRLLAMVRPRDVNNK